MRHSAAQHPEDRSSTGTLVGTIGSFGAFLLGATAGIGALLYSIGYLIISVHMRFLGVYGMFEENNSYFAEEGAVFLLKVVEIITLYLVDLVPVFIVVSLSALIIGSLVVLGNRCIKRRAPTAFEAISRWIRALYSWRQYAIWSYIAYATVLLLFVLHSDRYFSEFISPISINNVLYQGDTLQGTPDRTAEDIRRFVIAGDETHLTDYFQKLFVADILSGLLLLAAWEVTAGWRWRVLWSSWFILTFVVYTVSLPMEYGVLVLSTTKYPLLQLQFADSSIIHSLGRKVFLLNKTDQDFVIWDAERKRVIWIPRTAIKSAEVSGVESVFAPTQRHP
jgi:hypothetical protein